MDLTAGVDGSLRIRTDHPHPALADLLEVAPGAADRAAGADARDEVRDPAVGVRPDLGAGGFVVPARTVLVGELVRVEGPGDLAGEPGGDGVVRLGVLRGHGGRRDDHLGAIGPERGDLGSVELVRHDEHHAIAALQRDQRQADAGVAARGLDDRAAGPEQPVALGGIDDGPGDAVLRGSAGVEVLDLGEHGRADRPAVGGRADDGGETDEGRRADEIGDVAGIAHEKCPER